MATQSLYRRYRPRRFSEVKGQDHVVRALRSAVAEGREGQAYLFSGPRGTGKTTSARILAKVLNCETPVDGEPCCECESCLAVERGTSYDVHELDAASNNKVDDMRDLIEKASLGTPGRHKVYILDEVHMLTASAAATLLKTLEEPPAHVVFVLATTDPQKLPDTIRSRTQHLQFHLLPSDTLQEHARWVADDAGLDVSDAALAQALSRGGGSARDTLSALELVASTGDGGLDVIPLDEFVEAMIDRDSGRALTVVAHAITSGMDTRTVTEELIAFLRNGFLTLMAPDLVQLPSDRVDAVADQARRLGPAGIVRGIEQLGTALVEMRHAPDPRVLLDVATVQLTADSVAPDMSALLARLDRLERQIAEGVPAPSAVPATPAAPVDPATGRAALGGRVRSPGAPAVESTVDAAPAAGDTAAARAATDDVAGAPSPGVDDVASAVAPQPAAVAGASARDTTAGDTSSGDTSAVETPGAAASTGATSDGAASAGGVFGGDASTADTAPDHGGPAQAQPTRPDDADDGGAGTTVTAEVWENTIRPSLKGIVRAVYAPTEFVSCVGATLTLSVPNAVHRGKCEQHRAAVEETLAAHAGAPITIELQDGGDDGSDGPAGSNASQRPSSTDAEAAEPDRSSGASTSGDGPVSPSSGRARAEAARTEARHADVEDDADDMASAPANDLPDDADVDLDDLTDAPPDTVRSPIDRLAEAFPGSELIEEVG